MEIGNYGIQHLHY